MMDYGQKILIILLFSLSVMPVSLLAVQAVPDLPDIGVTDPDNNAFIDPKVDYETFMGRVSDKDKTGRILKIKVENNNTKFFKSGDLVYFYVNNHKSETPCRATVRAVEDFYFTVYVQDFRYCWDTTKYFPRGVQLKLESKVLAQRVFEASKFREILILRKEGFLKQLNGINHFLWTYDQQKMKTAADYDSEINELRRKKQLAIDNLLQTKQENLLLQVELQTKLNGLDESLKHYRVERQEYLLDRWNMDHDLGISFPQRPLSLKSP
jgi:hypothetical protein